MSDVARAIASIPAHLYWLVGKGRTRPSEPLYAIQLIDPESGVAIAEAEAEQLVDAIDAAVAKLTASNPSLFGDKAPPARLPTERSFDDAEGAECSRQPLAAHHRVGTDPSGLASVNGGEPDGKTKETANQSGDLDAAGKAAVSDRPEGDGQMALTDAKAWPERDS